MKETENDELTGQDGQPSLEKIASNNRDLLQAIDAAPPGKQIEKLGAAGGKMVRRHIRENGVQRLVQPFTDITDSDLNQLPDTDLPVVVEEMEPRSPGAKAISYDDSADTSFYQIDKFVVYIFELTTPEFVTNINRLRTIKSDLRKVITDNSLNNLHNLEDARYFAYLDRIAGDLDTATLIGEIQHTSINGRISRDSYAEALKNLENRADPLNNGTFIMNRSTAKDFLKWDHDEIGGELAQRLATDGLKALDEGVVMGVRHVFTIKRDVVPDHVVWQLTEPDFLGKAYRLQDITMYVSKEKHTLRQQAIEMVGLTIANVAGVHRQVFVP